MLVIWLQFRRPLPGAAGGDDGPPWFPGNTLNLNHELRHPSRDHQWLP
jgi:hypothetical protein